MKEKGECMNFITLFLKGILIGLFMLIPGVSGGTIAILLKIYEELLIRLNTLFKDFKNNFKYLFIVFIGGLIGVFISSYFLSIFFQKFYFEFIFIFVGILIYYSVETLCKNGKKYIVKNLFLISLGLGLGLLFSFIPVNFINIENKILHLFVLGILLAGALILPGISVSYVLLIFNMYDKVLIAIKSFDLLFLLEMGIALLIGISVVTKGLSYLLIRKKDNIENVIVGFVISSIFMVLPPVASSKDVIYMLILMTLGILFKVILDSRKS